VPADHHSAKELVPASPTVENAMFDRYMVQSTPNSPHLSTGEAGGCDYGSATLILGSHGPDLLRTYIERDDRDLTHYYSGGRRVHGCIEARVTL
jgi:hypothetical protein